MNTRTKVARIQKLSELSLRDIAKLLGCSHEYVRLLRDGKRGNKITLALDQRINKVLERFEQTTKKAAA